MRGPQKIMRGSLLFTDVIGVLLVEDVDESLYSDLQCFRLRLQQFLLSIFLRYIIAMDAPTAKA